MYSACAIYGSIMNELREPVEWLQFIAMKQKPLPEKEEPPK